MSVHPHRRGERLQWLRSGHPSSGSSPQAWGTDPCFWLLWPHQRFIPTGVGNGRTCRQPQTAASVHPHRRGERSVTSAMAAACSGSSPQAWGTGAWNLAHRPLGRFIPTGVGNGMSRTTEDTAGSVHPHRRGERSMTSTADNSKIGSSPQAWGTAVIRRNEKIFARFIPTGVGNGARTRSPTIITSVHPHRRGERFALAGLSVRAHG